MHGNRSTSKIDHQPAPFFRGKIIQSQDRHKEKTKKNAHHHVLQGPWIKTRSLR